MERMRNRGIPTSKINKKKDGRLAFFRDPDGNELCLWEYGQTANATETVESAALCG